jgi:hypothetical protein
VTDAVQIALIVSAGSAIPAVAAVVLGFVNRSKIGTVETKVDGHLTAMNVEIAEQKELILQLTGSSEHKAGQLQEIKEPKT